LLRRSALWTLTGLYDLSPLIRRFRKRHDLAPAERRASHQANKGASTG
jgi:hypothetical protein